MRKVKVAAVQPGRVEIPERYQWHLPGYDNDPRGILNTFVKKQLDVTLRLIEQAGAERCDIVTTCEDAGGVSAYGIDISEKNVFPELVGLAQPVIEAAFAELSRKHSMYIVGCYHVRENGKVYNTASVFDRGGQIVGAYRKVQLPSDEKWQTTAGDSFGVFDLDFGRVGIAICYDMFFQEPAQILALNGAEIIFHPTYGYGWYDSIGEATLRTRASDNCVYIVTSKNYIYNHAGKSSVIDPWGQVLADAGFYRDVIVTKEIDLDDKKLQPEWFFPCPLTGIRDAGERARKERRPEIYGRVCEPNEQLEEFGKEKKLEILAKIKSGEYHW